MQTQLRRSIILAGVLLAMAPGAVGAARANIISFDLVGNSDPVNRASNFVWADPQASVTLDFADDATASDSITLSGSTSADPVYAQTIIVRNRSTATWVGFDLSVNGTAGGIPNVIDYSDPASATATNLAGNATIFNTQSFTSANDIIFSGGTLDPGGIVVFHVNVNVPVSNNDFSITYGEHPLITIPVPEPASLGMLGLGLGALVLRRRRHA